MRKSPNFDQNQARKSPSYDSRNSPPLRKSPERNNNQIRPGTYKKSGSTPCDDVTDETDPTRGAIIAMVEKDVAFSDVENRRLLMAFIKKICQAH